MFRRTFNATRTILTETSRRKKLRCVRSGRSIRQSLAAPVGVRKPPESNFYVTLDMM